jgi:hypothetical protein
VPDFVVPAKAGIFSIVTPDLLHKCKTYGSAMPKNSFFGAAFALKVFPGSAFYAVILTSEAEGSSADLFTYTEPLAFLTSSL